MRCVLAGTALVLFASPAMGENWVTVYDSYGVSVAIDKDSIKRGSGDIVYFRTDDSEDDVSGAVECQSRVIHWFKTGADYRAGKAFPIDPNSPEDAELKYVCSNGG